MCVFQALFDYEVDSDDEWEEEDPGESVSSDEVRLPEKYPAHFIQDKLKISSCPGTSIKKVKCNSVCTEQLRHNHRTWSPLGRVSTSSGNHGKPGKSLKKFHAWKNH